MPIFRMKVDFSIKIYIPNENFDEIQECCDQTSVQFFQLCSPVPAARVELLTAQIAESWK